MFVVVHVKSHNKQFSLHNGVQCPDERNSVEHDQLTGFIEFRVLRLGQMQFTANFL